MITGAVSPSREAVVPLVLRNPGGGELVVDAVVDTGFTGLLVLPAPMIDALGLPPDGSMRVVLADASQPNLNVYTVDVVWGGTVRTVSALRAGNVPLVGMALLYGHELRVQVIDGGDVAITPLA